jgi:ankyrin repeat protein
MGSSCRCRALGAGALVVLVSLVAGCLSPAHEAAGKGDIEKMRSLLAAGGNVANQTNADEDTPLHLAAENGHRDMVKLLLDNRADIEARDSEGMTVLHRAARFGQRDCVEELLSAGASVDARIEKPEAFIPPEVPTPFLMQVFLRDYYMPNRRVRGGTALHLAACSSTWAIRRRTPDHAADVVRLLLEHGADINAQDASGATPLFLAIIPGLRTRERTSEAIELLLARGADPNVPTRHHVGALHMAVALRNVPLVRLLLEKGADPNAADIGGVTPAKMASGQIKDLLRQCGGKD